MKTAIRKTVPSSKKARPRRYCLKSAVVCWILDNKITSARLRTISQENNIGFLECDSLPLENGSTQDNAKYTRYWCKSDIQKIVNLSKRLTKAAKTEGWDFSKKLSTITD